MPKYCSTPLPEISGIETDRGTIYEVRGGAVGNLGATTVVCGSLSHKTLTSVAGEGDPELGRVGLLTHLHTPVQHLLVDFFLHKDLTVASRPELLLIDRMQHPHATAITSEEAQRRRMPLTIGLRDLGPAPEGAVTPHAPWYPRMLQDVCERGGWNPDDLRGYRLEMAYPPNPTALVIRTSVSRLE